MENLRQALMRKNISVKSYAEFLGVSEKTVQNKLRGKTDFSLSEFQKTCNILFPEYNPNYLFALDNSNINGGKKTTNSAQ